jgi:hypothetical protein
VDELLDRLVYNFATEEEGDEKAVRRGEEKEGK